jgi:hypothetical protein
MSMTSTKSFSTKNAGVLVVAVFSIAISMALSQVSSAMALDELLDCKGVANDLDTKDKMSCDENEDKVSKNSDIKSENDDSASSNDDDADQSSGIESKTDSVLTAGPAVASPDDHIIKPINLNKGTDSDEPLKTNNDKHKLSAETSSKQIFQDKLDLRDQFDKNTNTDVSELYESFDLPYTAIYKNQ